MAILFSILVSIVILGWLWFYIARPILEDYGVLAPREAVNHYQDSAPVVMSRSEDESAVLASSPKTDATQTPYRPTPNKSKAEEYLTLCQLMRAHGVKRDDALAVFQTCGIPFNSNVWRDAAPPEPAQITPIAGRPTDADFPYEPIGQ